MKKPGGGCPPGEARRSFARRQQAPKAPCTSVGAFNGVLSSLSRGLRFAWASTTNGPRGVRCLCNRRPEFSAQINPSGHGVPPLGGACEANSGEPAFQSLRVMHSDGAAAFNAVCRTFPSSPRPYCSPCMHVTMHRALVTIEKKSGSPGGAYVGGGISDCPGPRPVAVLLYRALSRWPCPGARLPDHYPVPAAPADPRRAGKDSPPLSPGGPR